MLSYFPVSVVNGHFVGRTWNLVNPASGGFLEKSGQLLACAAESAVRGVAACPAACLAVQTIGAVQSGIKGTTAIAMKC